MFFYHFNKNKTIYDLRKASSYTLENVSKLSGFSISELKKYENSRLRDLPKDYRKTLVPIFESQIGVM